MNQPVDVLELPRVRKLHQVVSAVSLEVISIDHHLKHPVDLQCVVGVIIKKPVADHVDLESGFKQNRFAALRVRKDIGGHPVRIRGLFGTDIDVARGRDFPVLWIHAMDMPAAGVNIRAGHTELIPLDAG